jgi:hypothetical protein
MPASAYSSSFAWGAYLVASLLLVVALYPSLSGLKGYSDAFASESIADGLSADLRALHAGMSLRVSLSSLPPGTSIIIESDALLVVSGSASTEIHLPLRIPNLSIVPGAVYVFACNGSTAEVTESV